jgi:hypothetical protein
MCLCPCDNLSFFKCNIIPQNFYNKVSNINKIIENDMLNVLILDLVIKVQLILTTLI